MARPRGPLRRLVLVPDPAPGESFHSWTSRIAERHQCKQIGLAPYLGLTFQIGPFSRGLPRKDLQALEVATGMPVDRHAAMTLASHGAGHCGYGWTKINEKSPWFWRPYTSSVCPACLEDEDASWSIAWQLVPVVACPIHRIFLHGVCPSCREPFPIGTHPDYRRHCIGPYNHASWEMTPPDECHHWLADLPRCPVADDRVFELQDMLLGRLRRRPSPPGTRFWNAYYLLLRRILCLGGRDLAPDSDPVLARRWRFFCRWRDVISRADPDTAEAWHSGLGRTAAGPMLTAAVMLIIEELCRSRTVATERALRAGPWDNPAAKRDWVTVNRLGIVAPRPRTLIMEDRIEESLHQPVHLHFDLLAIGEGHLHPALRADPTDFDSVRPWTPRQHFRGMEAEREAEQNSRRTVTTVSLPAVDDDAR